MNIRISKKIVLSSTLLIFTLSSLIIPIQIYANYNETEDNNVSEGLEITGYVEESLNRNTTIDDIIGKRFFIKNGYSGQYLDVYNGESGEGVNVWQYQYNGSEAQQWYIDSNGDGTVSLYTPLGNDGQYYRYALDISGGSGDDYANVNIWSSNNTDAQKFRIGTTGHSAYVLLTQVSNFSKCVVLNGPTCDQGRNVDQYTYQGHFNEVWILEPVNKNDYLGMNYAIDNYNFYMGAYPDFSPQNADCTNFVSQCMLAGGIHYNDNWYVYRKNDIYSSISANNQIDVSWSLSDPSPWINAEKFNNFWSPRKLDGYRAKGTEILNNPSIAWNANISTGCVVQKVDNFLGIMGKATHTMYITGYEIDGANSTYKLTYHSNNFTGVSLLDFCRKEPDAYYLFYVF